MTRVAAAALACALLAQTTFRSGADAVTVDVSVRNGSRVVTGLGASDFELLDNGVPQEIVDASYGKLPIDVTLALDVSYSVTGALLDRLRQAVRQLMSDLGPDDRLRLVGFNMRVERAVDFTSDPEKIDAALRSFKAGGGSSIRDALAVALVSASEPRRRQLIVIFTDGADNTSITTRDGLMEVARRTNASVASVIPGNVDQPGPSHGEGLALLRDLARETGGTVIDVAMPRVRVSGRTTIYTSGGAVNLTPVFRKVLEDFRSSYVLHYTPKGVAAAGFHTLTVRVKGRRSYTIRARQGYVVR